MAIKGKWNTKVTLPITCPECQHTTKELISKLEKDRFCVCGGCGKTITIAGDALDQLEALRKTIEGLK